ncbi:MAG: hypothetical protein HKN26_07670, partial [Acidimicrobiales bacterium]|nr:hypothetical protein [Acidimicrobiales bacterium]
AFARLDEGNLEGGESFVTPDMESPAELRGIVRRTRLMMNRPNDEGIGSERAFQAFIEASPDDRTVEERLKKIL